MYRHKVVMGAHNKSYKPGATGFSPFDEDNAPGTLDLHKPNAIVSGTIEVHSGDDMNFEIPMDDPNQVVLHKEML